MVRMIWHELQVMVAVNWQPIQPLTVTVMLGSQTRTGNKE